MGLLQVPTEWRGRVKSAADSSPWSPALRTSGAAKSRRKILIVEDRPSVTNILYVLLEVLNYEGEVAMGGAQALSMIARENYDAILLDLRYSNPFSEDMLAKIRELQPSLADCILEVSGEPKDSNFLNQIARPSLPRPSDIRLMEDVHRRLLSLWDYSAQS
jgi:DNA-binding NtrC family response regulator